MLLSNTKTVVEVKNKLKLQIVEYNILLKNSVGEVIAYCMT